jgi:hypothetical protein
MQSEIQGTSGRQAGSTRLLSTEELFEGFNELYESAEAEGDGVALSAPSGRVETTNGSSQGVHTAHLEITETGDAFNLRGELHTLDLSAPTADAQAATNLAKAARPRKAHRTANPVLRAIDLLADADRENITATLRGGMLEVKLPKSRIGSLAAARSALLGSVVSGRPRSV